MNKHRAVIAGLIKDIGTELSDMLVQLPPVKDTNRDNAWWEYQKLKNLHKALVDALEHST